MEPKIEKWREEFRDTRLYNEGGSCFECCDYEGIVENMEAFIANQIAQAERMGEETAKTIAEETHRELECMQGKMEKVRKWAHRFCLFGAQENLKELNEILNK